MVTLYDEGRFIRILAELPGITEEKIKIDLDNGTKMVTIIASDTGIFYKKEIITPCEVRFCKKRFFNSFLEISFEKIDSPILLIP